MMEALSPVDVNLCYSEAFQHPSSPNKKAEKFNIHLSMALLLKVLSKCNTCCQSWIEPGIVRKNREMAFRSIIKLCCKCHPSSGMEFMHTYYYPGNSKGSADPLAWKQYNLSFSFFPNSFWAIKFKNSNVHYNLWGCSTSNSFEMLCSVSLNFFFSRSGKARLQHWFFGREIWGHCMFDMTLPLTCTPSPAVLSVFLVGLSCRGHWDSGTKSDSLVREPTASCLTKPKGFARTNYPLLFQLQRLNSVCSFKDRVAVKWHTVSWHISVGQMKTFPASTRRGVQVK